MPDLTGTYVGANYRQQIVPFSRFGTRKIAWYAIRHADTNDGNIDMEKMNRIVDVIQTQMEIVMVGAPYISNNWGKFMVAVFEDTANDGYQTAGADEGQSGFNSGSKTLEQALQDHADGDIQVERFYLYGAPATGTNDYYGFHNSDTYREFDTKAEYEAGSYTQD